MSHQVIIIKSSTGGHLADENGNDEIQVTYTPPHDLTPKQVGKEVAKRLKWLDTLKHADAADT